MDGECCICLDSLFGREDIKQKPKLATMAGCGHIFHEECLAQCCKHLETIAPAHVGGRFSTTKYYKSHPTCPKCRAMAPHCRDGHCRAHYHNQGYGDYGVQSYPCIPYVSLFVNDTDTAALVNPKEKDAGILILKNKAGGKEKYNLASTVRTLGLDMQVVKDEVAAMLEINFERDQPLLGREHVIKMKNVKIKIENLLSSLRSKSADATLKAAMKDMTKIIEDLGKELTSDEIIGDLRGRIDQFDYELDEAINQATQELMEEHEGEKSALWNERDTLEDDLAQKKTEWREVSDRVKRRDKTINEHEKTIKKLTAKQKKHEGDIAAAEKSKLKSVLQLKDLKNKHIELEISYAELKSANAELKRQAKGSEKQQTAADAFAAKAQAYADSLRGNKITLKSKAKSTVIDLSADDSPERAVKRLKTEREFTPVASDASTAFSTPVKQRLAASGRDNRRLSATASADFSAQIEQSVTAKQEPDIIESLGRSGRVQRVTRSSAAKRKRDVKDDDEFYPESEVW